MNGNRQLIQGWVGCLFCITGNAEKFTEMFENRRTVAFFAFFSTFHIYSTGFWDRGYV